MGLDPNMDSWPLDQNAIVQILNSQSWSDLEWSEGDDEAAVESAQMYAVSTHWNSFSTKTVNHVKYNKALS